MRTLVPALILAVAIHLFFFMSGPFRSGPKLDTSAVPFALTLTLQVPKPEPAVLPERSALRKRPSPAVKPSAELPVTKHEDRAGEKRWQEENSEVSVLPRLPDDFKLKPDAAPVAAGENAAPIVSVAEEVLPDQLLPVVAPVLPTAAHGIADAPILPDVTALPDYSANPPPDYPSLARRRGYEGQVLLDVWVDRYGKVADLKIAHSSGYPVLDQAAVKAVRKWLFKPAHKGNETIESWVKIPIRFQLQ